MTDTRLLTAREAATLLHLTVSRVTRMAHCGDIPHIVLPGGEIICDRAELLAWLSQRRRPATQREAPPCQ